MSKEKLIGPCSAKQRDFLNTTAFFTIFGGGAGSGKALAHGEKVLTPTGFKNIEDMRVGDSVLTPNNTIEIVQAVYPQGIVDLYRIYFQDGRTIDCCGNHLWKWHKAGSGEVFDKVTDTFSLISALEKNKEPRNTKRNYKPIIPLCSPVGILSVVKQYPVKPYTLGAILGDGHIPKNGVARLTGMDDFIFNEITKEGYSLGVKQNKQKTQAYCRTILGVYDGIKQLKLEGTHSDTKFIPEVYKTGTVEDRFCILQGLFDTDGYICKNGSVYFDVVSPYLANDVKEMLESLGYSATLSTKQGKYKKDGVTVVCKTVYKLYVRGADCSRLFRLPRKVARAKNKKVGLRIDKIEPIGRGEATCISITGKDKLFVTTNYIVTHNSHLAQMFCLKHMEDPNFRAVFIR